MKKKLNCILLIDDDRATNFINERVIKKLNCTDKIVTAYNGEEALEFLSFEGDSKPIQPDLIFLDINMPVMNGWEFLKHYQKLDKNKKGKIVLLMLTTSLNPDDKQKAKEIKEVNGYKTKPLTAEMLEKIIEKHFPDYF